MDWLTIVFGFFITWWKTNKGRRASTQCPNVDRVLETFERPVMTGFVFLSGGISFSLFFLFFSSLFSFLFHLCNNRKNRKFFFYCWCCCCWRELRSYGRVKVTVSQRIGNSALMGVDQESQKATQRHLSPVNSSFPFPCCSVSLLAVDQSVSLAFRTSEQLFAFNRRCWNVSSRWTAVSLCWNSRCNEQPISQYR